MAHIKKDYIGNSDISWAEGDKPTLVHALQTFSYLLGRGETLTLRQFAARIREHYAPSVRINAICEALDSAQ